MIKDIRRNNMSHYTLKRVEHLRRALNGVLAKLDGEQAQSTWREVQGVYLLSSCAVLSTHRRGKQLGRAIQLTICLKKADISTWLIYDIMTLVPYSYSHFLLIYILKLGIISV